MRSLLFLFLASCVTAEAEERIEAPHGMLGPVLGEYDGLTLEELTHADVRGTTQSMEVVLEELRGLDEAQRREVREALAALVVTCPYNRSSVQLALTLEHLADAIGAMEQNPLIQREWAQLQQGLDQHRLVLVELGVDHLPLPVEGDYLASRLPSEALVDAAGLAQDPLTPTVSLLEAVQEVVSGYEDETRESIDGHRETARALTIEQWPMKNQFIGWRSAMLRMEPFIADEEEAAQVRTMIELIDRYVSQFC